MSPVANGSPARPAGVLARDDGAVTREGGVTIVSAFAISTAEKDRPPHFAHCSAVAVASVAQAVQINMAAPRDSLVRQALQTSVQSLVKARKLTREQTLTYMAAGNYTAKDITVLEGLEPVRKRPGMYIGGVGSAGLHHLVWETLDNSVDEAMNGFASNIWVTLHADGSSITIEDDGRGIPIDKHPTSKKSALEVIFTVLHAGGKFEHGSYKTAGGLHGVGASVVNALSKELVATVKRDGSQWEMRFKQGQPVGGLKKLGVARGSGTKIFF